MKKVVSLFLAILLCSQAALADCDFSTGIRPGPAGTHEFIYSDECHLKVGQLVQQNATLQAQVGDLTKAIELKDLAITKADARAQLWMDTSQKLEDRVTKINELQSKNNLLYYGLGIITVFAAAYVVKAVNR